VHEDEEEYTPVNAKLALVRTRNDGAVAGLESPGLALERLPGQHMSAGSISALSRMPGEESNPPRSTLGAVQRFDRDHLTKKIPVAVAACVRARSQHG
jgi:hypothetical protein